LVELPLDERLQTFPVIAIDSEQISEHVECLPVGITNEWHIRGDESLL
jgi:hypothetical protein